MTTETPSQSAAPAPIENRTRLGNAKLRFDDQAFELRTIRVDGQRVHVRAFENIVYVANPVDSTYQSMNIYVPEAYFSNRNVGIYTAETAPIFLPNQVGGYMPAEPGKLDQSARPPARMAERPNTIAKALARGYVVASPGARGRTTQNAAGQYNGKAPAAIVDLKAAVRYLRYNDGRIPGDAGKIISNGTSAGGALSALLGASGNHDDYDDELQALGAAPAPDNIFAVSAYCPITNLEHADSAYEWMFNGVNDYKKIDISMLDYQMHRREVAGTLTSAQIQTSDALKPLFPTYVNSLGLKGTHGEVLQLDANGNGSFKDAVKAHVIASAQTALDTGTDLSQLNWLNVQQGRVVDMDWDAYVRHAGRMKLPPAFDGLDLSTGENQLFGSAAVDKQHFTDFSQRNSTVANAGRADAQTVKMMNAMNYIDARGAVPAQHWRIRHGTKDRDTSLAIPVILATTLQNRGYAVDFALPWDRPHSGDYDLDDLFAWMDSLNASGGQ
ncbi:MAG: subtype B tannase [Lautropia sp.]|nr:subtype B tannase [Lautropia sp.]